MRASEFGMTTSSPLSVRIVVARNVTLTTSPCTVPDGVWNSTQSPMPYCFSAMMNTPPRKSPMRPCAPKPTAAEMTVAGMAAAVSETPIRLSSAMITTK